MVIIKCHLLISELLAATIKKRNPINIKYFFLFGIIPFFYFHTELLHRKKETLKAFLHDLEWAVQVIVQVKEITMVHQPIYI